MLHDYNKQADRQIILAPVFKYAAIGITIGVVFVAGIAMLEHKVNNFDQEVSELKAQLASQKEEARDSSATNSTATVDERHTSVQTEAVATKQTIEAASTTNESVSETTAAIVDPVVKDGNTPVIDETENRGYATP